MRRHADVRGGVLRVLVLLAAVWASVLVHVIVVGVLVGMEVMGWIDLTPEPITGDRVVELVRLEDADADDRDDDEDRAEEEEPEKEPEQPEGQIVELPPPLEPERADEAEYLAEHDHRVEKETRAERFEVNPEVLAPRWSPEQRIQVQGARVPDLHMDRPSTGATAGIESKFDPSKSGVLAATPSKWKVTNLEGTADPVPAAALQSVLAGAPQNDLLDEELGAETALATKEFLYASYLLRIRRLVNFYWNQNLDNLPNSVRLAKPEYTTVVKTVLDGSGALESLEITAASGSPELDDAVARAFKVAGPYPNPPAGLVSSDGRVYLPEMRFTVELGVAEMRYDGIDPRAGVQFPGILKSPR